MKIKTVVKATLPIAICFSIVGTAYYFVLLPKLTTLSQFSTNKSTKIVAIQNNNSFGWKFPTAKFPLTGSNGNLIAYSSIRDPGGIPQGLPVRLQIPVIGVDTAIEDAAITPDGRMDVPVGSVNVAWFALGPHPGQVGSAVIGGHFGIENGVPFVFYNLDKVKIDDKIDIVNDKNETLSFVVRKIHSFDRNDDATTVFTSQDGLAHLNLITCEGVWNQVNGNYPQRLVVFTDSIPSQGPVTVNKQTAAAKTQQTTTKVTPIPTQILTISSFPRIGKEAISTPKQVSIPQMIIASAQSLYATPLDGFITSFLLIAISSFIAVMIFR